MDLVPALDAAHRAALTGGKPLVYVCPPAAWAARPMLAAAPIESGETPTTVIVVPEIATAWDVQRSTLDLAHLQSVAVASGRTRIGRLLRAGAVRTLVVTPQDALDLVRQTTLKLTPVRRIVILWPETAHADAAEVLDTLLADARDAQRIFVTSDETRIADLLTRHAHRAPVAVASRPPHASTGTVRFATASGEEDVRLVVQEALNSINPDSARIWDPLPHRHEAWASVTAADAVEIGEDPAGERVALVLAVDCVSQEVIAQLRASAEDVLVVLRADQVPYLERLVETLRPFPRRSEADRARDRASELRRRVRERVRQGGLDGQLLALAPLFQEFDPALVAAAAADLAPAATAVPDVPDALAKTRVHLDLGSSDRLRPGDVVGVIANVVGIPGKNIGRIDIRDRFTLVEVRPDDLDAVVRGLTGAVIRGRRVSARPESR